MNTLNKMMRVSTSGMAAERFRMDVISSNIANANSMRVNGEDPYRRRIVHLNGDVNGVKVTAVSQDQRDFRRVHEPGNPHADMNGDVFYSNIEPIEEMVNMLGASRAYEANIAAFNSVRGMIRSALNIGKI
jgi:flagellar basal-body rod protein FlgC